LPRVPIKNEKQNKLYSQHAASTEKVTQRVTSTNMHSQMA